MSDPSASLLVSLAASLKQSYDPLEVASGGSGEAVCVEALSKLSGFLAEGYLKKAGTTAAQSISATVSLFVKR